MADEKKPTIIKKYANRRLYHTGTSTYVTLDELAKMIQKGEEFEVQDAKTGEDITRSVLAQIIFEQEGKSANNLLPIPFLRQLIGFYGDALQGVLPTYLEASMQHFAREQQKFREQFSASFGPASAFSAMEEQARRNMAMFQEAMRMFLPFGQKRAAENAGAKSETGGSEAELESLRRQMAEIQKKLDTIVNKS